jgi:hypothetical protein
MEMATGKERYPRLEYQWTSKTCKRDSYHFLGCTLGQGIAIAQIVDFDVFDIVAVLLVDVGL